MTLRNPALVTTILAACALALTLDAMSRASTEHLSWQGNPGVATLIYPSLIGAAVWLVRSSNEITARSLAKASLTLSVALTAFLFTQWLNILYSTQALPHYSDIPREWLARTNGDIFQLRIAAALVAVAIIGCAIGTIVAERGNRSSVRT